MARRGKGEGSVIKLADGRWRARIRRHGQQLEAERRTKKEAVEALQTLRLRAGVASARKVTVQAWLDSWLPRTDLADNSRRLYQRMVTEHLVPHLGHLPLADLDAPTIDAAWDTMARRGVGTSTIGRAHAVLASALAAAARAGLIVDPPTRYARPPRHSSAGPRPLTREQARAVLVACDTAPSGPVIATILLQGLRASEAIGLDWGHVDLAGGWLAVPGTKNEASAATVPLTPTAARHLRSVMPADPSPTAPVFTGARGGRVSRQTVHRHWHAMCDALGIDRRRLHDLRHSCGTLLAELEVHPRAAQQILRHADPAMTAHYSRQHDPAVRDALSRLDQALS